MQSLSLKESKRVLCLLSSLWMKNIKSSKVSLMWF